MKLFNIIFIVLFILFAAVQYNDPNPYLWMPIYLYAAYLCYESIKGVYHVALYIMGLCLYGIYAIYLLVDKTGVLDWAKEHNSESIVETMKATKPWIEETREFFGLVIVMIVLVINMISLNKKRRTV